MPFGDAIFTALPRLRAAAEALMVDTCTVRTAGAFDPESGQATPGAVAYQGKCKVQTATAQERTPEVAGATQTVQRLFVHFPIPAASGGFAPQVGHVVTIETSRFDPKLPGRSFRVVAPHFESLATAYRVGVEEVS